VAPFVDWKFGPIVIFGMFRFPAVIDRPGILDYDKAGCHAARRIRKGLTKHDIQDGDDGL
jgi:hypothetical protein